MASSFAEASSEDVMYILSLKRPERDKQNPRSIEAHLKGVPGVNVLGGDPYAGLEVEITDSAMPAVRRRLQSFAHIEVREDMELL